MDTFNFPHLRGAKSWQEPHGGAGTASRLPRHGAAETPRMLFCTGEEIQSFKVPLGKQPFSHPVMAPTSSDLSGVPSALQTPFFFFPFIIPCRTVPVYVYYGDAVPATTIMALS